MSLLNLINMWEMMGDKIKIQDEVLFRQIHPKSFHGGVPGSDRFRPSDLDMNLLSVDRSALTSAMNAHALFVSTGRQSAAVFGVEVREFAAETIACHEDPIAADEKAPANVAHALADYSTHTSGQQKVVAKRLTRLAIARGCLFQAGSDEKAVTTAAQF